MGAVRGRGRAGVRSMRRCGVCLVVVHGRVEAVGLGYLGGLQDGSRSGQSGALDLWTAFSVREDVLASWTTGTPWG